MTSPVFFDGTGKRRKLVGRLLALLLFLIIGCAIAFATTIVDVPAASPLDFSHEREQALPFLTHIAHWRHRIPHFAHQGAAGQPIRAGFYVPWDAESAASLRAHYDQLDWVIASNAVISRKTGKLSVTSDPRLRSLVHGNIHRPRLFLMVQNVDERTWFSAEMQRLFRDRKASDALISDSIAAAKRLRW